MRTDGNAEAAVVATALWLIPAAVDKVLRRGRHDRRRHRDLLPPRTVPDLLRWADAHRRRTGRWPNQVAGPIPEAPGETWGGVHNALRDGRRGLPGGSSLDQVLRTPRATRGVR